MVSVVCVCDVERHPAKMSDGACDAERAEGSPGAECGVCGGGAAPCGPDGAGDRPVGGGVIVCLVPAIGEGFGDEAGGEVAGAEGGVIDDIAQEGLAGLDAEDRGVAERGGQARGGDGAIGAIGDDFGDQRIVIGVTTLPVRTPVSVRMPSPVGGTNSAMVPSAGR